MTVRILQFGTTGQLAREMLDRAPGYGATILALSRAEADLCDLAAIERHIDQAGGVDVVVNAAAYTAVDRAESEPALAHRINGAAPGAMARACARRNLPLVHVSTDYVFNGEKDGAWTEADTPDPIGLYGASKLAGERAIAEAGARAMILRPAWVFSPYGANFVKTMLRLAADRPELRVVDDQWGQPTAAGDLADFILQAAPRLAAGDNDNLFGIFHFAGRGPTTWRGFAQAIIDLGPEPRPVVTPITTDQFPTPARRPRNSQLDTTRLKMVYGVDPRPWRAGLIEALEKLRQDKTET